MRPANTIMANLGTTVFEVMSRLAMEHGSINLGQGFPDEDGPRDIRQVAADALVEGPNQYPPMTGLAELRQAIAAHARRFYGLDYDWQSEIVVTSGATEALADCFLALLNPGDEVVLLEPLYDSYPPMTERAGAIPRYVTLEPPGWELDPVALEAAFTPRTRMILLNSPMNPAARVLTMAELDLIRRLCIEHDVICLCDEVYEHLLFDGLEHRPIASLDGMRERTLRISSAGKIFSLTGWKVGWIEGPAELMAAVMKAHQFVTFTTAPNLQKAVAYGLGKETAYYTDLAAALQSKRDRLAGGLAKAGFPVLPCQGTYFINADITPFGIAGGDEAFCRLITEKAGVTAVPVSAFIRKGSIDTLIRFCFCKKDDILDAAADRLQR
ncbi:MAG: aminotransferase, partial [bacterium]|nr:aminotransferase [bacterium]